MVVILALAAAVCFASASVLQQRAAQFAPPEHCLRIGLLAHLARRPRWVAGILADAAGYLFQVLALDRGALSLVQPLLASGLLFALAFNAGPRTGRLRHQDWAAALAVATGLAVFVIAGAPKASAAHIGGTAWGAFAALSVVAVTLAVLAGQRRGHGRATPLAAGGGIAFGLSATLTKQALLEMHHGVLHMLWTGYPYALVLAGGLGMLLATSAFQCGSLASALPTLTLAEPIFAASSGIWLFGERVRAGTAGIALVGAAAAAAGVVYLARSPRARPVLVP